jgi:hypothetical protein
MMLQIQSTIEIKVGATTTHNVVPKNPLVASSAKVESVLKTQ